MLRKQINVRRAGKWTRWLPITLSVTIAIGISIKWNGDRLHVVTTLEFAEFVEKTGYVPTSDTAAFTLDMLNNLGDFVRTGKNWMDGNEHEPVHYVSFNDAQAYAAWKGAKLPTKKQYWKLAKKDKRQRNIGMGYLMEGANVVGGVWDYTAQNEIVGGSFLCNHLTCRGYLPENFRTMPDSVTTNNNIGFAIIQ